MVAIQWIDFPIKEQFYEEELMADHRQGALLTLKTTI